MNRLRSCAALGLVACTAMLGIGCGSSDPPPSSSNNNKTQAATFNTTGAKAAGSQVSTAVATILKGNGHDGAMALSSAGMSAFTVISYAGSGAAAPQALNGLGEATQADTSGTCDCPVDGTSCTFTGCSASASGYTWAIDGTMSWGNGKILCDLTYSGTASGFDWQFHESCDLAVTKTSIDGTLKSTGSEKMAAQGQNLNVTWDTTETFKAVTFPEAGGCPTGGSLEASATVNYNGAQFTGSGTATFDGTCN